jgi:hypothetical protein
MNNNKMSIKRFNKNKSKNQSNRYRIDLRREASLLGVPVRKTVRYNELIYSILGSQNLLCNTSSSNYWNLSSLSIAGDFTPYLSTHQMFKLNSITLKLTRVISETALSNVYVGGATNLYVAPFPTSYSTVISAGVINNQENSITVPPFYNRSISRTYPILNASLARTSAGISYTVNLREWCNMANLQYATGQISVAGNFPTNATTGTALYEMEVSADFTFAVPI